MGRKHDTRRYKRLVAALRREQRQPCWLCQQPIDYDLQYPHPESFSADHVEPVTFHPELALVYSNLAPSHLACNTERRHRDPRPLGLGDVEGMW